MLVCYLDDSGKDPQSTVTTLAGYIGRDCEWELFEDEVEQWFREHSVETLHAKELSSTNGDFRDWKILKKQAFVARVCQTRNAHVMMGLSMSTHKQTYKLRAMESKRKRIRSPYAFCFNAIIDWILRDIRIGKHSNSEGVALILELGHENNPDVEQQFHAIRKRHGLENILKSIDFIQKKECRAIQLADLLAFYSRRRADALAKAKLRGIKTITKDVMLELIVENLPHRTFVATDFGEGNLPFSMKHVRKFSSGYFY